MARARPPVVRSEPAGLPRSRKGVQTRTRLLSAAKEVFEREGFLEARIVDIAETAQLAPGSFYHYSIPRSRSSGRSRKLRRSG